MSEETKIAIINLETGLVDNIAAVRDGDGSTAPDGFLFVPSEAATIGDSWDGAQIVKAVSLVSNDVASAEIQGAGPETLNHATVSRDEFDALAERVAVLEAKGTQ